MILTNKAFDQFKHDTIPRSDLSRVLIGLSLNLNIARYDDALQEEKYNSMLNLLFDKAATHTIFGANDTTFSIIYLSYLRAKHFNFPKNYLFELSKDILQFGMRKHPAFHPIMNQDSKYKNDSESFFSFKFLAANIAAFCAIKGEKERDYLFNEMHELDKRCLNLAVLNANQTFQYPLEFEMLKKLNPFNTNEGNTEERINTSKRLIELTLKMKEKELTLFQVTILRVRELFYSVAENLVLFILLILFFSILYFSYLNRDLKKNMINSIIPGFFNFAKKMIGLEPSELYLSERLFLLFLPFISWLIFTKALDILSVGIEAVL